MSWRLIFYPFHLNLDRILNTALFSSPEQLLKFSCPSVGPLVRPSVGLSVRPSTFVKKWSLEYQKIIKTHLHTYLQDSSYSSDISDSSDNSDSSDSSDSNDSSD